MTQPAGDAAATAVVQDTPTPPAPTLVAPQKPPTPKELADEIKHAADVEMGDLRKLMRFNWLSLEGEKAWKWGANAPINDKYLIMAMFHSDDEVRAYAAPLEKGPYICYRLRKDAPSYGVETMSLDTFRESVIDELNELEEGMGVRDIGRLEGRAECVDFIRELAKNGGVDASGAALTLEQLADKLEADADDGAEGEEEEV